nr:MAG TPA: hypothetical protein [Caudoviricetes sp.]DAY06932.1 MAG TPA: hypothetical protein [Caudoviricetes sp.]
MTFSGEISEEIFFFLLVSFFSSSESLVTSVLSLNC